jgi:predicted permease
MGDFIRIFEVVLPVILLVFFGYITRKLNIFDEEFVKAGSRVVFLVFLPLNMFFNIYNASGFDLVNPIVVVYAFLGQLFLIIIGYIIYKKMGFDNETIAVLLQTLTRSNIVLFGLSIAQNYFNIDGVALVTIYIGLIAASSNAFAILIYEALTSKDTKINYRKMLMSVFKNPILIAAIFGLIFNALNMRIYEPVMKAAGDLASVATPLGLMCVGGSIKFAKDSEDQKALNTAVISKAVLVPVIMLSLFAFLGLTGPEMFVMIILFAAPVAVSSHAMSIIYTSKGDLSALIIVYTTIINSIVIFLAILILSNLGII